MEPEAYYEVPDYYNDTGLVKPYRVGMSCGCARRTDAPAPAEIRFCCQEGNTR